MDVFIGFFITIGLVGLWWYYSLKSARRKQAISRDDLDDETVYVEGIGNVNFEELDGALGADPEAGVKEIKDSMFREDLMQFEGEFLIADLPLAEERRQSIDEAFLYLAKLLGKEQVSAIQMLTLYNDEFHTEAHSREEVTALARTIARIMDIDPGRLRISFFDPEEKEELGQFAGFYEGLNDNGEYEVSFSETLHRDQESLIATIAHEFAHIKLLGEARMTENSEDFTDMVPLFYGFGLFNANAAFKYSRNDTHWSTSKLGYLSQVDWAYLFALVVYLSGEHEPAWMKSLNKTVAKDSRLALKFILANPERVLPQQQR